MPATADIPALSKTEFELFQQLLVEESGLYFDIDKADSLYSALYERLKEKKCGSYAEYYSLLKFQPEGKLELFNLLDLITIGETFFFRNEPQFEALMKYVLPEIVQNKMYSADKSIKIWSAGCSRGTEPYSIAIAVMQAVASYQNWNISILGTDINRNVLIRAKEAVYNERDISLLPPEYLCKYFKKDGKNYILNEDVKKLVEFKFYNLVKGPFNLPEFQNLDIIFCRNVIIYFNSKTINQVITNFYNSLNPNGYLFLGHAENLWQIPNKFTTIEFPNTFLYKKILHQIKKEIIEPFIAVPDIHLEKLSRQIKQKDKLESSEKSEHAHLAKAIFLANQAKYNEAIAELKKIIQFDNLHSEAYYLYGVLAYKIGNFKEAEEQFKKVIYIEPDTVLAYYNLGNIYLYQKKFKQAQRELNNTIRLLEKMPKDKYIQYSEDFTVEFLLRACKNSLSKIAGASYKGLEIPDFR